MNARRWRNALGLIGVGLLVVAPLAAQQPAPAPQTTPAPQAPRSAEPTAALVSRAIDHENAGRYLDAVNTWRQAIAAGAVLPGILGLERTYAMLGDEGEILPLLDSLVAGAPNEPQLRGVQLRTYVTIGRDADARAAFAAWRTARPNDITPYRDFARVLLFNNKTAVADSVLNEALAAFGNTRAILLEAAQLRAATGRWREAADAWRETMRDNPYFESAAVFSLQPAPEPSRAAIREELTATGTPIGALQALAMLEIAWGQPRAGWQVLNALHVSDTAVAVWRAFAEEAERAQAWAAQRDALSAIYEARRDPAVAENAAGAALLANDAESALRLSRLARRPTEVQPRPTVLALELEALARLGRGAEAEMVLASANPPEAIRRSYARTIAWAWIRSGNVAKARAALATAPLEAEDAVAGWLALFDGDLAQARRTLREGDVSSSEAVAALALLSRTTRERSALAGQGFLQLARGDSVAAADAFIRAATELPDATPLLLAMAARIHTARRQDAAAVALWTRLAGEHTSAPEAAEARLEWARALRRRGDHAAARQQYEQLILTFPGSALVPQARRELQTLPPARSRETR